MRLDVFFKDVFFDMLGLYRLCAPRAFLSLILEKCIRLELDAESCIFGDK